MKNHEIIDLIIMRSSKERDKGILTVMGRRDSRMTAYTGLENKYYKMKGNIMNHLSEEKKNSF